MARSNSNASQRRKLALIIGNGRYNLSENRLDYAKQNADELSALLKSVGFKVTLVHDIQRHEFANCFVAFSAAIREDDLVLIYFCGQACHVDGTNFLIPTGDNDIETKDDFEDSANKLKNMITQIADSKQSYATIFIFDCSKPYLVKSTKKSKSLDRCAGLNKISPSPQTFIQFARSSDDHASTNLYFEHLLKNIVQENVELVDALRRVEKDVAQESNKKQQPLSMDNLDKSRSICLNPVVLEKWDEVKPSEMAEFKKKQAELKACYDNYPTIDELTKKNKSSIEKAEGLTKEILSKTPSGDATKTDTVCHVLYKLFEQENQECLFFDSTQDMKLHDASSNLADFSTQDKPFVLKLNNVHGLGTKTYADDGQQGLNVVQTLERAREQNQSHPVLDDIVDRLAKAHDVNKKQIKIKNFFYGSCGVVYTVDDLPKNIVKSLSTVTDRLRERFEQFQSAKIHPLLFRPSFDISQFDERGNKTFTEQGKLEVGPPGRKMTYYQPVGWTRYGLKVLGRYENDTWLDPFGHEKNWYKAYHGTGRAEAQDFGKADGDIDKQYAAIDAAASIHKNGFREARVHVYGAGVYCSPDPTFPVKNYVGTVELKTEQGPKKFMCMLQVAVNPDGVTFTTAPQIWVVPKPKDIRTYGILIKEV
ncbi:unnamed protein product [Adineta ricciae]|uniref:Caspase family p20 domain-containing protein n=1 Tax=Adineta ricciae TaxID=249248 RepID=A0A814FS28_ADIRI|nr:unnamed protein product [Adineta ricciae]CAF1252205.1 unnamed protein product [Adineta ricciae]